MIDRSWTVVGDVTVDSSCTPTDVQTAWRNYPRAEDEQLGGAGGAASAIWGTGLRPVTLLGVWDDRAEANHRGTGAS
jgi:hypothetical protein